MKATSLKKNLIYNTIYQVTVLILPLITAPYISRVIGAEGLGIYSYKHSIALYFVYFAMLGLSNYGNRTISQNVDDTKKMESVFSSIYFFQAIISTIVFFVYLVYSVFFVNDNQNINFIMSFHVVSAFFDVSWLFFGLQEFKVTSIRQIVIKILSFIAIFVFVKSKDDLWIYTLIMSLSYFLSAFILWIMMWKKIKLVKCNIKEIFSHFKPCLILFIPIIATSVYRVMDKIMIGKLSNMSQVGYYENAEKIILISLGLLNAFSAVIMPRMSNLISKNKKSEAIRLLNLSMEVALCLGMAIAFGIAAVSKEFIPIFFGNEFSPSINISIALCFTVPFITWSTIIRSLYIIPSEKDKIYVQSVVLGAIFNFILNLIFIPIFSGIGAVIGTIAAEVILALYQTIKVKTEIPLKKYIKKSVIFLGFGLFMFFIIMILKNVILISFSNITKLILEICIGGFVYILMSSVYFYKTKNKILLGLINQFRSRFKIGVKNHG